MSCSAARCATASAFYWSHCGTYLVNHADMVGEQPLRSLDDVEALGARVRERGFTALKCNMYRFDGGEPYVYMPGFGRSAGDGPELNLTRETVRALRNQISAFQEGSGGRVDILVDLNFNFRTDGYMALARALDDLGLYWIEIDNYDPEGLAMIRRSVTTPIALLRIALRTAPVPAFAWNGIPWTPPSSTCRGTDSAKASRSPPCVTLGRSTSRRTISTATSRR